MYKWKTGVPKEAHLPVSTQQLRAVSGVGRGWEKSEAPAKARLIMLGVERTEGALEGGRCALSGRCSVAKGSGDSADNCGGVR